MRRALAIKEKAYGPDHPEVTSNLNSLALLLHATNRLAEAEALIRRALTIDEKAYGPNHPDVASDLNNLALLLYATNRLAEAELFMHRVIAIFEKVYGPDHTKLATALNNLAVLHEEQNNWADAAALCTRAKPAMTSTRAPLETESRALIKAVLAQNNTELRNCARAQYHVGRMANLSEGFALAQWAMQNTAADALNAMSLRFSKGDAQLAQIVRAEQDFLSARTAAYRRLDASVGRADAKAVEATHANITKIEAQLAAQQAALRRDFPDYAALASPQPLAVAETQTLLGEEQALVVFIDMWQAGKIPGETLVFALTKHKTHWLSVPLGTHALRDRVMALRCGLDEEEWATPTKARRCADLLGLTEVPDPSHPLPFHLGKAYDLYKALFGQIEEMIAGKQLIIVPSGPLTSLPFHVLVTKQPQTDLPATFEAYQGVPWFGRSNAIVMLPSVSSLKALRQHARNGQATANDYAGYGNPQLQGDGSSCGAGKVPETCPSADATPKPVASADNGRATIRGLGGRRSAHASTDNVYAKGAAAEAVLEQVRSLCPLPDTAYEIKCTARYFKKNARLIRLAADATEADIKASSRNGQLARYRILHFATHGLLSGDVETMAKRQGEPALVLTPPAKPADADDNGLLTASEVAQLKLNADWVVLSACNTAAGDQPGGEALSGLARAFFYAGDRALLVSHWPVYSDAAVRLTTRAFAELDRDPKAGRAEAFQRSMIALMGDRSQTDNAHPAVWAPFVVVGDGGR